MLDYADLAATAQELVEEAGRPLELRGRATAPADPAKPWRGPGAAAEASEPVVGVVLDFKLTPETSDFVKRGDKRALVAAASTSVDVTLFGTLVDGSKIWNIESIEVLNPGDTKLLYTLHLRK